MWEWVHNNWWILAAVVAYLLERIPELSGAWRRRAFHMVDTIERYHRIAGKDSPAGEVLSTLKTMIGEATPECDKAGMSDLIAAAGDDKHERSNVRKVAGGVVRLLPLVSRVAGLIRGIRCKK